MTDTVHRMLLYAQEHPLPSAAAYELNARVGHIRQEGARKVFVPSVDYTLQESTVKRMEAFRGWSCVMPWVHKKVVYFTGPNRAHALIGTFDGRRQSNVERTVVMKRDVPVPADAGREAESAAVDGDNECFVLRLCLCVDRAMTLQEIGCAAHRLCVVPSENVYKVRMLQQQTFYCRGIFRYMFSRVWTGRTVLEADQRFNGPPANEMQLDCIDLPGLLGQYDGDVLVAASSFVMKAFSLVRRDTPQVEAEAVAAAKRVRTTHSNSAAA